MSVIIKCTDVAPRIPKRQPRICINEFLTVRFSVKFRYHRPSLNRQKNRVPRVIREPEVSLESKRWRPCAGVFLASRGRLFFLYSQFSTIFIVLLFRISSSFPILPSILQKISCFFFKFWWFLGSFILILKCFP